MTTQTLSDTELSELLANEIPCGGNSDRRSRRKCDKPAVLLGHSHGCTGPVPMFKCITCWQAWYATVVRSLTRQGHITCWDCGGKFHSVESFCDYRPF